MMSSLIDILRHILSLFLAQTQHKLMHKKIKPNIHTHSYIYIWKNCSLRYSCSTHFSLSVFFKQTNKQTNNLFWVLPSQKGFISPWLLLNNHFLNILISLFVNLL